MLQRGKLPLLPHAQVPVENNNAPNFQQAVMQQQQAAIPGGPGPMSVEELEARLRGPGTSSAVPPKIDQNFEQNAIHQPNRCTTPQQQDMAAFKKLVRATIQPKIEHKRSTRSLRALSLWASQIPNETIIRFLVAVYQ